MSEWMRRILESKRPHRAKLAVLSFEGKIRLVEKLRLRTLVIQGAKADRSEDEI